MTLKAGKHGRGDFKVVWIFICCGEGRDSE